MRPLRVLWVFLILGTNSFGAFRQERIVSPCGETIFGQTSGQEKPKGELVPGTRRADSPSDITALCPRLLERYPLVVMTEGTTGNWLATQLTTLVLYRDGTVIYWEANQTAPLRGSYKTAHLSTVEQSQFIARVDSIVPEPPPYQLPRQVSDPVFSSSMIQVRGPEEFPGRLIPEPRLVRLFGPGHYSRVMQEALRFLATFFHPEAVEWMPDIVQVTLYPAAKPPSGGNGVQWPEGLPGLQAATQEPADGSYTLQLSRQQFAKLKALLDAPSRAQVVLLEGKRFRVRVTYLFPHQIFANTDSVSTKP